MAVTCRRDWMGSRITSSSGPYPVVDFRKPNAQEPAYSVCQEVLGVNPTVGVRPSVRHFAALLKLANDLGLGHLFPD